jgi:uncharacterized protein (DUF58 family)
MQPDQQLARIRAPFEGAWVRFGGAAKVERAQLRTEPVARRIRPFLTPLTPLGKGVLFASFLAWLLGWRLGWVELFFAATVCLLVMVFAVPFVLGRNALDAAIELSPVRLFVGTPAAGRLIVRNVSKRRLFPVQVDLRVGAAVARFDIPSLGGDAEHEEIFVVPTNKRAVISVGPATSVQADPLGVLRREVVTSEPLELFVHPAIVALPTMSAGLLRDLEGQETKTLSASDLAFHTLRDYAPGDDRRYVHWRSSAKAGKLLVRQFLDTRRSRVTIAVDADVASYRDEDEFELGMSVAASLGVRCLQDGLDVTCVAGGHASTPSATRTLLDIISRGQISDRALGLMPASIHAASLATDTSLAVLITGSVIPFGELRQAAHRFGPEVTPLAIRVEMAAPAGITRSGGMTVIAIRALNELPRLLVAAVS